MTSLLIHESPLTAVATPVTLTFPTTWGHCFIGVKMVDGGDLPVLGTSGSFTIQVYGPYSDAAQSVAGGPIVVPAMEQRSFSTNATKVIVTPASIVGAVQYKVIVGANQT